MLDLSKIVKNRKNVKPPRITIYGTPKIGKTTFASQSEKPLILDLENGSDNIDVPTIGKEHLKTFNDVMNVLRTLYKEDHEYKTVIIDSIDWLERMVFDEIAKEHNARTIDDFKVAALGFGRGYTIAQNIIKQLLNALDRLRDDKGMLCILVCHSVIKKVTDPEHESFDHYTLKLNDKVGDIVREWSDCLLFATQKVYVTSSDAGYNKKVNKGVAGERVLYTSKSASYVAGNRYQLPNELPLDFKSFWKEFKRLTDYGKDVPEQAPEVSKAAKVIRMATTTTTTPSAGMYAVAHTTTHATSNMQHDYLEL